MSDRGPEPWKSLNLGDVVRIVRMPSGVDAPGYTFHPSTRKLYECLIACKKSFQIREIDQFGQPWIHIRARKRDGSVIHHGLALVDDSWDLIEAS